MVVNSPVSAIERESFSSNFLPTIHSVDENIDSLSRMWPTEYFKNINIELWMKSNYNSLGSINKNMESKSSPLIQDVGSE